MAMKKRRMVPQVEKFLSVLLVLVVLGLGSTPACGQSNLTQGHQVILENGLQLGAFAFPQHWDDGLNLPNWEASNYTTVNGYHATYSIPTGLQWSLWTFEDGSHQTMAVTKKAKLRYVQLWDEQSIASSQLAGIAAKVATLQAEFPNAMVYLNQGIGSSGYDVSTFSLSTLMNYTQTVKPDMLSFTEYPFRWEGTGYVHDYDGGSPTTMYVHMEMYRLAGLAGLDGTGSQPIPVSMYVQRFAHADSSATNNNRQATESEMRLQQFAAFASGMKITNAFVYGTPPFATEIDSAAFVGVGDTVRDEPAFSQIAEINRQSQNLGFTLARLISTDFRMKMGRREDGVTNPLPADVASGVAVVTWDSSADAYLKNVSATNLGSKNNGMEGDVIVGFLKPLDASLVPTGAENDPYFMIVNGLSDGTGNAADCQQQIHMEFDFADSGINQLLRRSRLTGDVEQVSLTHDSGSLYYLDLTLDGGTGDLFKYDNSIEFITEPPVAQVHYTFKETAPGTWEVLVDVTGDTAGLSAYEIWVDGVDAGTVTYAENILGTSVAGFMPGNLLSSDIAGSFNAGNYQSKDSAIEDIGMDAVNETDGAIVVDLDAQALLGILTSIDTNLTEANFRVGYVGLFNEVGNGFFDANGFVPTIEVIEFVFLAGDANGDGVVSAGDYASVQANFGNTGTSGGGLAGDANGDGVVSAGDYAAVQANFGNTASTLVPEPAIMSLLLVGGIALIRKRK